MTIGKLFDTMPKSERTLQKHGYQWNGAKLVNDTGKPCFYRAVINGNEIGAIVYYRGRLLTAYERQ